MITMITVSAMGVGLILIYGWVIMICQNVMG